MALGCRHRTNHKQAIIQEEKYATTVFMVTSTDVILSDSYLETTAPKPTFAKMTNICDGNIYVNLKKM